MKKNQGKSGFPMQLTKRVYLTMILLVTIPMILLSIVIWMNSLQNEKQHRGEELFYLASKLDRQLIGSFDDILTSKGGLELPVYQQVNLLQAELQPIIETFVMFHPTINLGYFSKEHDRILAIGPEFNRKFVEGTSDKYPYAHLFNTSQPKLEYEDFSIYWPGEPVLTQVFPIYRQGKLIGYTWASIKMDDIYRELLGKITLILVAGLVIIALSIFVSWWKFNMIRKTLSTFAETIVGSDRESEVYALLPELNPILEMIKDRTDELVETNSHLKRAIQIKERTEKELIQSEERFSKAFTASPSLMCILDYEKDYFIAVNESFLEKTGYNRQEIQGKTWRELIEWTDPAFIEDLENKFRRGEKIHNAEGGFYSRTGQAFLGLFSIESIKLNGRRSLLCVITDITERKHFENELMKLDRLNLIGQMAAGISHEIRNPMTTVRGFLQMLGQKEDNKNYQDYYQLMIDELDRANSIITEFLSIGRNKIEEQKVQDLNAILRLLTPLIEADAAGQEKSLVLELGSISPVFINEKEIRQVILNLSRNGLEAMERGGKLLLKTYEEKEEVILCVRDSGGGMSPEVLHQVGTPFFTTKDRGTGLGLAVCYGIIARHHAKMTVTSGTWGTEFQIHFPLVYRDNLEKGEKASE